MKRKLPLRRKKRPESYAHLVDRIEHDPLIRHKTLKIVALACLASVLLGSFLWYGRTHPRKLIRTGGQVVQINNVVTSGSSGIGYSAVISFKTKTGQDITFKGTSENELHYKIGQPVTVGYNKANPNYARNLSALKPTLLSWVLWLAPLFAAVVLIDIAIYRHHKRQQEIWNAAEAANVPSEA